MLTQQKQQQSKNSNNAKEAATMAALARHAMMAFMVMGASVDAFVTPMPRVRPEASLRSPLFVATKESVATGKPSVDLVMEDLVEAVETEAELAVQEMVDETCEIDEEGAPVDEICVDEEEAKGFRKRLKSIIGRTLKLVRTGEGEADVEEDAQEVPFGEVLERGWEKRANSSALRRNAEVWKFALQSVFRTLKPRSLKKKGASEEEVKAAQVAAATFIRDGLLVLGPSFVKLGQVVATRTDVLPATFTDVLKTLQDEVPGFSSERAKEIVSKELGKPFDEVFTDFSEQPLKAASLGQVHTAYYKGKKVAIKVQRAGLKELFDVDLKNLKKLAELLDKFDPKSDGADRDWVSIYEESERLLYLEIDYLNEAANTERFAKDFKDIDWVRIPDVYKEVSTPRVLVMEFVDSLKLTDIEQIDSLGLDKELLAKRTADAFLRQIVETAYFHCGKCLHQMLHIFQRSLIPMIRQILILVTFAWTRRAIWCIMTLE